MFGIGMNIGNDQIVGAGPDLNGQNLADLQYIANYTKKVRVALPFHLDVDGVNRAKALVLQAKQLGLYVVWGVTGGAVSTAAEYNTFINTSIAAAATWAQANGVDEFVMGNEEDWNAAYSFSSTGTSTVGGGKSATQVRTDIKNKYATIKAIFTNGPVTYSTSQGTVTDWGTEGTGSLDRIGVNCYDSLTGFQANIPYFKSILGAKFYVTEWNTDGPYPSNVGYSPHNYANDIAIRRATLMKHGIEGYFFTWRWGADEPDSWNVKWPDDQPLDFKPGLRQVFGVSRLRPYGTDGLNV